MGSRCLGLRFRVSGVGRIGFRVEARAHMWANRQRVLLHCTVQGVERFVVSCAERPAHLPVNRMATYFAANSQVTCSK